MLIFREFSLEFRSEEEERERKMKKVNIYSFTSMKLIKSEIWKEFDGNETIHIPRSKAEYIKLSEFSIEWVGWDFQVLRKLMNSLILHLWF